MEKDLEAGNADDDRAIDADDDERGNDADDDDQASDDREATSVADEEDPGLREHHRPWTSSAKSISQSFSRYSSRFGTFSQEDQQVYWKDTIRLAYQSLGVVYGDLGTSPLYVYPTIQLESGTEHDYLGILSLIFWSLTLIGVFKYVLIVLQADDYGEGGTFALYSLLCRNADVARNYAKLESDKRLSFFGTRDDHVKVHTRAKKFLENSKIAQKTLLIIVMIGTCMVIGDGVLTPAISVLSAAGGIRTEVRAITQTVVVLISCGILIALFILQSLGTNKVSFIFSPIMVLWFASTTGIGIFNIAANYPGVLKGLSPHYLIHFFRINKRKGWEMLGAIVLCITGAEAMFADLGHFNKKAIQVAFIAVVYPSLILTYAGETAYLIKHPQNRSDAFFKSIPHVVYWPMFVIATLAAIVASQALISATFSVLKQSMSLGCFPRIKLVHTSPKQEGQIYSPEVNYLLLVLCLAVVLGFQDGADIGNAFGVAVIWVMLITTFLVAVVMLVVWRTSVIWILLFVSLFGAIETIYLSAVLQKLVQGGWVPFAIAAVFLTISLSWNYGRGMKYEFEAKNRISSHEFEDLGSKLEIKRVPGMCLFYSNLVQGGLPPLMVHYMKTVGSLHEIIIFLTIRVIPVKTVLESERLIVARGRFKGLYRCVARYGYLDNIDMNCEEFRDQVIQSLIQLVKGECEASSPMVKRSSEADLIAGFRGEMEMLGLNLVRQKEAVHVVGHSILKTSSKHCFKRFIVNKLYRLLHECSRSAVSTFKIPSSLLLEVAMVYET